LTLLQESEGSIATHSDFGEIHFDCGIEQSGVSIRNGARNGTSPMLLDDDGTTAIGNPLADRFRFNYLAPRVFQPGDGRADKEHDNKQGG
jgi:hypothetical protein